MDNHVRDSLEAALENYARLNGQKDSILELLLPIFEGSLPFLEKVASLDAIIDDHSTFEELREILFDLLLINFFMSDVQKLEEDYLESAEWESIEERTLDRGTELLNVLLYIRECKEEELDPELEDYLNEYLLVNEDEFQDEYRIYEPIIANQALIDSDSKAIANAAAKVEEDSELVDLFYPLMSFFYDPDPEIVQFESYIEHSNNKALDAAIYGLLISFNRA